MPGIMELSTAILIHLVVPIAGLQGYSWLRRKMSSAQIQRPPVMPLFVIFATYGGWLMVGLTLLFWYWSGIASIGLAYLVFIAPIVMIVLAVTLYKKRRLSRYHFGSFIATAIYPCVCGVMVLARTLYLSFSS